MSSSSSLAAARRRRVGGAPGPNVPNNSSTKQSNNSSKVSQNKQTNPFILLQKHDIEIFALKQAIKDMKNNSVNAPLNVPVQETNNNTNINIDELSNIVTNNIQNTLDLNAFVENDQQLFTNIEELRSLINSQQLLINELNNTLYYIINNLNLNTLDKEKEVNYEEVYNEECLEVEDTRNDLNKKSVTINEDENTIQDIQVNPDANLEIPPVD